MSQPNKKEAPAKTTDERTESHKFAIDTMTGDYLADRRRRGDYNTTEEQAKRVIMQTSEKVRRESGEL